MHFYVSSCLIYLPEWHSVKIWNWVASNSTFFWIFVLLLPLGLQYPAHRRGFKTPQIIYCCNSILTFTQNKIIFFLYFKADTSEGRSCGQLLGRAVFTRFMKIRKPQRREANVEPPIDDVRLQLLHHNLCATQHKFCMRDVYDLKTNLTKLRDSSFTVNTRWYFVRGWRNPFHSSDQVGNTLASLWKVLGSHISLMGKRYWM